MTALSKRGRGHKENQKFKNVAVTSCCQKELILADGFALFCLSAVTATHKSPEQGQRRIDVSTAHQLKINSNVFSAVPLPRKNEIP